MTTPPWCREKVMVYYIIIITILIMAINSSSEKFGRRFSFVVSSTGAIAVSSYE